MSNALAQASRAAFIKLQPQLAVKSPVMLVVWVGTLLALVMTANSMIKGLRLWF